MTTKAKRPAGADIEAENAAFVALDWARKTHPSLSHTDTVTMALGRVTRAFNHPASIYYNTHPRFQDAVIAWLMATPEKKVTV